MIQDLIAGIDIGGTKAAVAIAIPGGEIIARTSFPTGANRPAHDVVDQALTLLADMAEAHESRLTAAGIGCAGPLDLEGGIVISPPNLPRSWRQFPLRAIVEAKLGVPVTLDTDANAAVLGEHFYGAGRGYSDLVYLTISTGIGGGIIAGNNLVHRLGEAGHVTVQPAGALCGCGARGCLEALCSGTAIARRAQEQLRGERPSMLRQMVSDGRDVTAKTVEEAARAGDDLACEVWQDTITFMAIGIGGIIASLAPQAVILGGGVAAGAGEFLLQPLRAELRTRVRILPMENVAVLKAGLGADSGIYGALVLGARALQTARS